MLQSLELNGVNVTMPDVRHRRRNWKKAFHAMDLLLKDGEDTKQAFEIINALAGRSVERSFGRFLETASGRGLFERREELAGILDDHAFLRQLPAGSFGRAYLTFVTSEGLSAQGVVEENGKIENYQPDDPNDDLAWYSRRLRDMHDLWHVLTGYGRDGLGELALLAFSYSQSRNPGLMFIAYLGARADRKDLGFPQAMKVIWIAKAAGKRAAFLPSVDVVDLFARPLDEVRRSLCIESPITYQDVLPDFLDRWNRRKLQAAV